MNSPSGDPSPIPFFTTTRFESFDTRTNKYILLPPMPVAYNHANAAVVNNKIYVLGGLFDNTTAWDAAGQSFVYDVKKKRWSSLPSVPKGQERGSAAVAVYGDKIFLAGGMTSLRLDGGDHVTVSTTSVFDTKTNRWTTLPSLSQPRDHAGGVPIGHIFYVLGGRAGGIANPASEMWTMDMRFPHKGWRRGKDMITGRAGMAVAAVADGKSGGRIYAMGGEGNEEEGTDGVFDDVEVYNVGTGRWKREGVMKVPRHGLGAVVVDGKIYVPGGGIREAGAPTGVMDVYVPGKK